MYSYENEQKRLHNLMEHCLLEDSVEGSVIEYDDEEDVNEEDALERQDTDTDTEQEISDCDEVEQINQGPTFTGKDNCTLWKKHVPNKNVRTRSQNLVKHLPGVKAVAKNLKMEFDIWKHFFSDKILDCIMKNTNDHIRLARANYTRERDAKETDTLEVQALLGLCTEIQSPKC